MKPDRGSVCLLIFLFFTLGGANEQCGWEERSGITLQRLTEPAIVLREYSDVPSARDCYLKCCELKFEGCNVAAFMTFQSELICMNVKCEPFDNCIWGPYLTSVAAVISRPSNAYNHSFSSASMGGSHANATMTPSGGSQQNQSMGGGEGNPGGGDVKPSSVNATAGGAAVDGATSNGTDTSTFVRPHSNDPNNPFHPDYRPPATSSNNSAGNNSNDNNNNNNDNNDLNYNNQDNMSNGNNNNQNYPNSNGGDLGDGGDLRGGVMASGGNETLLSTYPHQVNYAVSVTLGVVTCFGFLGLMYLAARKFSLFQDRSRYSRLLENPEQYADNFSASEFED